MKPRSSAVTAFNSSSDSLLSLSASPIWIASGDVGVAAGCCCAAPEEAELAVPAESFSSAPAVELAANRSAIESHIAKRLKAASFVVASIEVQSERLYEAGVSGTYRVRFACVNSIKTPV